MKQLPRINDRTYINASQHLFCQISNDDIFTPTATEQSEIKHEHNANTLH